MLNDNILAGHVAVVTGAASGIGLAIARELAACGGSVAVADINADSAAAAAAAIIDDGGKALAVTADVAARDSVEAMFGHVESELGPVDILVNNAGITRDAVLHRMTKENWDAVIHTNLDSVFNMTRLVIEGMRARSFGRIISISSINGRKGQAGQANYAAAKAALLGFSKAVAQEAASRGITVNVIAPGYIATEMVQAVPKEILDTKILPFIPVGRLGTAEEVARCVTFLADDAAGFITGACLDANGGQYMA
jgi:acetoacetyl-CoA reductase